MYHEVLSSDEVLLFDPLGSYGVMILNQAAFAIWRGFAEDSPEHERDRLVHQYQPQIEQMMALGLLQLEGDQTRVTPGKPDTLTAWMHITNQCNLRCDYCYIEKTPEQLDEETGAAAVDTVFRSALRGGFRRVKIKFSGGEASLNPQRIVDMDSLAQFKAASFGLAYEGVILSNGVHISDALLRESQARNLRWMISLDGLGNGHDQQRRLINGKSSARLVTRTIDKMVSMGLRPFIGITVTGRNTASLAETVRFVLDRNLPFNLSFVRSSDHVSDLADMQLQDALLIAAVDEICAVIEANLPSYSLLGTMIDRANFGNLHTRTCAVGQSYMVIDHRGKVGKCHMEIERSVTDIYAPNPLKVIQEDTHGLQNLPVDEKEGCRTCEWKYWCAGGCPKLTYKATGRYDVKSPYCNIYKAVYPKLLRLEALRLREYQNSANRGCFYT